MRVERGRGVSYLVSNLRGEAEEKLFEASPLSQKSFRQACFYVVVMMLCFDRDRRLFLLRSKHLDLA